MKPCRKFVARFRSIDRSSGIGDEFALRVMDRYHDAIMHRSLAGEKSDAELLRDLCTHSPLIEIRVSVIDVLKIEREWFVRFTLPSSIRFLFETRLSSGSLPAKLFA